MNKGFANILSADLDHVLHHSGDILEEFRDSLVFITGGTGFFGTWLLETFAWANIKLGLNVNAVILSRNPANFQKKAPHLANHDHFKFINGDVRNFTFPEGKFHFVFHLATEASDELNRNDPLKMFDTIVEGTRHVLDFSVQAGVKKFLLTSSGAVYGKQPSGMTHISEDYTGSPDPLTPLSAYGEGKRTAELLSSIYSQKHGIQVKIARCFAFVGPYLPLDKHFAIGNFILDGIKNRAILINGDGTPFRSYLYASDLVIWLITICLKGVDCVPYNVGAESAVSIAELATVVSDCFSIKPKVTIESESTARDEIKRYVPSTMKARIELGLKEEITLTDGIIKTINFTIYQCENSI